MKIRDVMTRGVKTVSVDDDLEIARQTMLWGGFRHLPVIEDGRVVGMISERDILRARASAAVREGGRWARVLDVMRVPVETASPDDEVDAVATRMAAVKAGAMPVVDESGALAGMVTTTDLLAQLGAIEWSADSVALPAVEVLMSRHPPTVRPSETIQAAASRMAEHRVRHLPVVEEGGKLVGILSDRDVLRALSLRRPSGRALGPVRWQFAEPLVRDAMTGTPIAISPASSTVEAMSLLVDRRISALPVVDGAGSLVGIVSWVDILEHLGGTSPVARRKGAAR